MEQASSAGGPAPSGLKFKGGTPPSFAWNPVSGAASYAFFMTSDSGNEDILFSSRVESSQFSIPEGAQGLDQGEYFFSVIPLDNDGNAMGTPAQSSFQTQGWSATAVSLDEDAE